MARAIPSRSIPSRSIPSRSLPSRSLPSRSLPTYTLPSRALALISEYSNPLTRPDWRKSKPIITIHMLYNELIHMYRVRAYVQNANVIKRLIMMILINIENTEWFGCMILYVIMDYTDIMRCILMNMV